MADQTKWSYREAFDEGEPAGFVLQKDGQVVGDVDSEEDAQAIVRAVNLHEELERKVRWFREIAVLISSEVPDMNYLIRKAQAPVLSADEQEELG